MSADHQDQPDPVDPGDGDVRTAHQIGHFYSPVCNPVELAQEESRIWPADPVISGLSFQRGFHRTVLKKWFPRHMSRYDYAETGDENDPGLRTFFTRNSQFSWLDSRLLFVILNQQKPRRMIEVGSGFSSLLAADVNARFLNHKMEFSCIEPYPRPFLSNPIPGVSRVITARVQDVELSEFARLGRDDILFIDSSHVAKTGSDVNYLLFKVLPALRRGVWVHFHDIFLPFDYPRDWVLDYNRSWNEQYAVQALLMNSTHYRVLFGCGFALYRWPNLIEGALDLPAGRAWGGGSLWIKKLRN